MDRFWKYKLDHWLFWIITIGFHAYTRLGFLASFGTGQFLLEILIRNSLLAGVIYLNLLVLMPRYSQQKKYIAYWFFLTLSVLAYVFLKSNHDFYLNRFVLGDGDKPFPQGGFYNLSIVLFYLAFSVAIQLSKEWYFQKELIRKIELEKLNTELDYLRAQINPHFLFNSINTIYFQIDKQNVNARDTLMTFSEMLRYQLYECNGHEIPVEKEVNYLRNYTELQRIRKEENFKISFTADEKLTNFNIVPLLLIPFVENAFKHVSHFTNETNEIRIALSREGSFFRLMVFNTREDRPEGSGGIGLKNVRRRLELLYPGRYELDVREGERSYEVNLKLSV